MKTFTSLSILIAATFAFTACGKKKEEKNSEKASGKVVASCDKRQMKGAKFQTCVEFTGSNWDEKNVKSQCVTDSTFIAGSCPSEGILFSCTNFAGKPSEAVSHYYNEADAAKEACTRTGGVAK